jgi:predicted secreted protein
MGMKKSIWVWAMVALISLIGLIIMNAEARAQTAQDTGRIAFYVPYQGDDCAIQEVTWIGSWGSRIKIKDGQKTKTVRVKSYEGNYYQAHQYGQAMNDWKTYYKKKLLATERTMNAMMKVWKTYTGKEWGE